MHAGPRDLERRQQEVAEDLLLARDLELRRRQPAAARRRQDHVHGQPPAALAHEVALGGAHHLGRAAARLVGVEEDLEAALVDAHRIAHRLELGLALDGARVVELDVEVHELETARGPSGRARS